MPGRRWRIGLHTIERNHVVHADLGIVVQATTVTAVNKGNVIRDNKIEEVYTTPIAIRERARFCGVRNTITRGDTASW